MIIVRLAGGLGNQLFQYAVARNLAFKHNVEVKLDITLFETYKIHQYFLHPYRISENIATHNEIRYAKRILEPGITGKWYRLIEFYKPYYKKSYIKEPFFHFDPNILQAPKDTYLDGYWQSEKYFQEIKTSLLKEFTPKEKPDKVNTELAEKIAKTNAVSIHVRRGDYISNPVTRKFHGEVSLDYYRKAVQKIVSTISSPHFFIFSDDAPWVKKNIKLNKPATYLSYNGISKNYEDLRLMSLCNYSILANSTFSWWGAWLNQNSKMVIAPKKWFGDDSINTKDLFPDSWIRI